ncbi:phosphodiesterase [Nocardioides baekrokdamisoli]|uniref:Phosphodiesterase n=1 Tax=Nocardioides baekrokdamisoli TaxID=1804624 RepID=A0A3G9IRA2_9ACTN|nr:alkaline phosphatase family protein [Nocardioides baekrokdamisoli]BBH16161.1 phosphodiesterase [Nocardioides baekrokdamisoli]
MSFLSRRRVCALAGASAIAIGGLAVVSTTSGAAAAATAPTKHVLLISIDGMHQSDLQWWVSKHPTSTIAQLMHHGVEYTNVKTSNPSDSDPGGTALMTGGNPKSTGVYYDVEYSHKTDEPALIGASPTGATCTPGKPATGGDVIYDSPDDKLPAVPDILTHATGAFPSFDENGTIFANGQDHHPAQIMNLRNNASSFNFGTFPVDPATCKAISPWDYLGDNSIFQVIHAAGMRTAWSDKHAIYMSFNGPGSHGKSIDDFFGPEIDSQAIEPNGVPYPQDDDWAHIDAAAKQYDGYKVQAVLNQINGFDHSGRFHVGTPAIFGMNFQAVSVAQKIPLDSANLIKNANGTYTPSAPRKGGYELVNGQIVPGPVLSQALAFVNGQLTRMVAQIHHDGLAGSTTIIITAKHGQSPTDPRKIVTIKDGPIVDAINAAWAALPGNTGKTLIVAGTNDDLWQSYLSNRSVSACAFVKNYLWTHSVVGADAAKNPVTVQHSGLAKIWSCSAAAAFFGVPVANGHYPDVFGEVQEGVIYAKPGKKLAEHGGMNAQDRHVLMIVSGAGVVPSVQTAPVETTQVAPTILRLLGLNPSALRAVRVEGTRVLPGA